MMKILTKANTISRWGHQLSYITADLPRQISSQSRGRGGSFSVVAAHNCFPSSFHKSFATKVKRSDGSNNNNDVDDTSSLSYYERKMKAKEQRIEAYRQKVERAVRIGSRRDSAPKDVLKNEFRSWWVGRKSYEERLDRRSRQAGMDWTIQVSTIVERLPVVLPDKEDFETEFEFSQAYLTANRGKVYPKEFTGVEKEDIPEAYTDEELLALLPENFKPASRETKADEDGTVSTLERRLKDRVYLLFDGSFPTTEVKTSSTSFASGNVDDEGGSDSVDDKDDDGGCESLLEAALRGLKEQLVPGTNKSSSQRKKTDNEKLPLDLFCPSEAPLAVRLEPYDIDQQKKTGRFGTKTFFMKVQYDDGTLPQGGNIAWLDRTEIMDGLISSSKESEAKFYGYLL